MIEFLLGFIVGRWAGGSCPVKGAAAPPTMPSASVHTNPRSPADGAVNEAEQQRKAFEDLMRYNADTAYGLNRGSGE